MVRYAIGVLVTGLLWSVSVGVAADGNYELSRTLGERIRGKVTKANVRPEWMENSFWYRNSLTDGRSEYVYVDAEKGERRLAFDAVRLAEKLTESLGKTFDPERLSLTRLSFSESGDTMTFSLDGKRWDYKLEDYSIAPVPRPVMDSGKPFPTRMKRSRFTGDEVYLTFENRLDYAITLSWVNDGAQTVYATIKPGQDYQQHTYEGHIWRMADLENRTLAVLEAGTDGDVFEFTPERVQLTLKHAEQVQRADQEMQTRGVMGGAGWAPPEISPDGKWRALIQSDNVVLENIESAKLYPLTQEGNREDGYENRIFWAPDSQHFVVIKSTRVAKRNIHFVESSPTDQLEPKLHTIEYVKPGDELEKPRPKLFSVAELKAIPVSEELQPNPWDISEFHWSPDSKTFYYLYNQRGHQRLDLLGIDAVSGAVKRVVAEESATFIDYSNKTLVHPVPDTDELIWMSERDGWNHLYLYDLKLGKVKKQLTSGEWVVRKIERLDDVGRQAWFWISGFYPEQDPYYLHLARVNYDGSGFTVLTQGDGMHSIDFSPNGRWLIDRYSRVDMPPVTELRRATDGGLVCELEHADWSELLATGWIPPERFVAMGRDGVTPIYGVITRPTNFDPNRSYPIIEEIYAGPHDSFTQKAFAPETKRQSLAEVGFILVQMDGMGTNNRGKKFHDVCWKNLGDSGFPDRILWIKAAAAKYPYMDTNRVGIYGGSAGGQSSTRALLAYGDFYKVAVSDCGCHDNRMDKIWWNEAWMGWPIGPHYAEQSNVTQAHRLTGKLFLTVGEMDSNVDPSSTMQVVNALIKADKDFEMLIVPGSNHGAGESRYADRKRTEFFVKHLLAE